ncbi:unnamed protein product [Cuscuta epithymum]|uniref:Uncharacterized protein n=1 Tax=Cuscuta epithymum TaxID=186058 RepID=A0AAV0D2L0_9ASTE|nr:unnamed protein product [Cuscuta epithymum]
MDLITTGVLSEGLGRESLALATCNLIMEKIHLGGPSYRLIENVLFFFEKERILSTYTLNRICADTGRVEEAQFRHQT